MIKLCKNTSVIGFTTSIISLYLVFFSLIDTLFSSLSLVFTLRFNFAWAILLRMLLISILGPKHFLLVFTPFRFLRLFKIMLCIFIVFVYLSCPLENFLNLLACLFVRLFLICPPWKMLSFLRPSLPLLLLNSV